MLIFLSLNIVILIFLLLPLMRCEMKQLLIKDFSNAYEFKQAKKAIVKQCKALKNERKNKRNVNFN